MRNALPGRQLVRCEVHRHAWYPKAAGCAICKLDRRAQQLASQPRNQVDNESPATADAISASASGVRDVAGGSASTAQLVELHNALSARAVQRATQTIASIDRALEADEQQRRHEARALEQMRAAILETLCGHESGPKRARLELVQS